MILKRFDIIEPLLALGADPNFTDGRSYLPLFIASRHGHEDTVRVLLKWGAKVNGMEITKMTALHIAAFRNWGKVIDLLIECPNVAYTKSELNLFPHDLCAEEGIKKKLLNFQSRGGEKANEVCLTLPGMF